MFRKFVSYYKPYKFVFFFDLFCAFVLSMIDIAFPQLLRWLTATFYTRDAQVILHGLGLMIALLLVMYLVRAACRFYITCQGHIMGAYMESQMRQDLFDQYQRFSFSYYDRNNTGEMMSKLVSDLFDISELAHHGPENIFISLVKIIGSFVLLLRINVPMTMILGLVVLGMILFSVKRNRLMRATFNDNRKKIAAVNARLQDSLAGIRVVKSFANESVEQQKFAESNGRFLESKRQNYIQMGIFQTGNNFFEGLMYIVVLAAGGFFIARGQLTAADLAVYALYINIFINPVNVLVEFTEQLQKGMSGFKRFAEVIDTMPEIVDAPDAKELTDVKGVLDFKDVSFSYEDEECVLTHVDIHVDAGQNIALVGPSGGGKTTLCSLLPRFYDVQGGAVCVDGKDVRILTQKSLREAIGVVQQDVYLFAGSIRENIAYGKLDATEEEIVQAARNAAIHDFIQALPEGYDTYVGERGTRLSGGQKQRIAIARVFLKNPPILILDEATSALDNESEQYIQESLNKLAAGRTTITIAHRLSTIKSADEIIVIDGEGIKERGTHEELMKRNGIYARYQQMAERL
ncbi:MAG: ABC transporter ATP-binding protein [Lachnospiraceae bacterium]|nr:ABC transporter ATP-binding protein [Lachnospiraceae bacterium]